MPDYPRVPAAQLLELGRPRVSRMQGRIVIVMRVAIMVSILMGVLLSVTIFALSATGSARFVPVLSDSMAPEMPVGSLALTLPVAKGDISVGDVIVFTNPNRPSVRVIHRITHIYGDDEAQSFSNWSPDALFATTKGDNNPEADPWVVVTTDANVWRLSTSLPFMGQPAIWLSQPMAPVWLIGAGVLAAVVLLMRKIWWRTESQADEPSVTPS
jgi:signal peptidase